MNSESEILKKADSEPEVKKRPKEPTIGTTYIVAMGTNFKSLYLRAYNNAFKILKDQYKKKGTITQYLNQIREEVFKICKQGEQPPHSGLIVREHIP